MHCTRTEVFALSNDQERSDPDAHALALTSGPLPCAVCSVAASDTRRPRTRRKVFGLLDNTTVTGYGAVGKQACTVDATGYATEFKCDATGITCPQGRRLWPGVTEHEEEPVKCVGLPACCHPMGSVGRGSLAPFLPMV